jgi:hypothetical protein
MKVYLSKSNDCDYDELLDVRSKLTKAGYKILEHTGGTYNPNLIKEAAFVILLIPPGSFNESSMSFTVGKGQYSECNHSIPVYASNRNGISLIREGKVIDSTNWKKFGELFITDTSYTWDKIKKADDQPVQEDNVSPIKDSDDTTYYQLIED